MSAGEVSDAVPSALIVVDASGSVAMVNDGAYGLLGLSAGDIGLPFRDLAISFHPAELGPAVENVQKERRPLILEQVPWPEGPGTVDCLDIHVVPVHDASGWVGVAVSFIDVSLSRRLHDELERSNRDVERAYRELQTTIEELESTSELLRSNSGDLSALHAEVQSTKEELKTINEQLRERTSELNDVNDLLESMLLSQQAAVAVVGRDMRIIVWSQRSAELWGMRPAEAAGRHFLNVDIGLPVEELRQPIHAVLEGESERESVEIGATNRRGQEIRCLVSLAPLVNRERRIGGVIILMEPSAR